MRVDLQRMSMVRLLIVFISNDQTVGLLAISAEVPAAVEALSHHL